MNTDLRKLRLKHDSDTTHNKKLMYETQEALKIGIQQHFSHFMKRICQYYPLTLEMRMIVMQEQALIINDTSVGIRLEEDTAYLRIYIDLGSVPAPDRERVYFELLCNMSTSPVPPMAQFCINPESERVLLLSFFPLPFDEEGYQHAIQFLESLLKSAEAIRTAHGIIHQDPSDR